ncbi:MAG TPA: SagB/ThcOx family dehydrogenase [Candidatus Elarobacter sp.]|nr:SagB/ThcOx family dehydrogenase [Candidatus Elarobacter sp.]
MTPDDRRAWNDARLAPDEALWELFHENTKSSRFDDFLETEDVIAWQTALLPSLPYEGHPSIALPAPQPLAVEFADVVARRATTTAFERRALELPVLSALLFYAYGETRANEHGYPSAYRAVPSAGALYPLELYFYTCATRGLPPGLYHYDPSKSAVSLIREGITTASLGECLLVPALADDAEVVVFITAAFERTTYKYGDRGYRFVLLEAGHVAQNIALAATALGLGCLNLGGFRDRETDRFLEIDGVRHSAVYLAAVGTPR